MKITSALFYTLLAIVVLGGFYFLTLLGPKKVDEVKFGDIDPIQEGVQLLKESERLEMEFEKAFKAGALTEESVEKLRDAITLQERYIDRAHTMNRAPAERLMKLQTRLQNIESKPLSDSVETIAAKAYSAEESGNYDVARQLFKEAYDVQSKINANYPLSKYKNIGRRVEFDRKVKMLEARPTYLLSVQYENAAIEAREQGNALKAKELFEKTLETISILHSTYPSSVYTDFARLMKIEADLQSLQSGGLAEKMQSHIKTAEDAKSKGDYMLAAEAYSDALECQKNINKLYPKSVLVSEGKVKELTFKKVEAQSWNFAEEIKTQDASIVKYLHEGDIPSAVEIASNLIRKVEYFSKNFEQSKLLPEDILMRLRYIDFMSRNIEKVQAQVKSLLIQLDPKNANRKMIKTEVSQDLYSLVMQENPSRFVGEPKCPVDSVTLEEAKRFAQRVSWVIGYKVTLPTEQDYRAAIGSLRYVDLSEISWNNMNSGGKTHPVATKKPNDKGFYDLLGNVSEFVGESVNVEYDAVKIVGGGVQTSLDAMSEILLQNFDPKQRNRTVGFRIVVDFSKN